jgi:hypothetical protein
MNEGLRDEYQRYVEKENNRELEGLTKRPYFSLTHWSKVRNAELTLIEVRAKAHFKRLLEVGNVGMVSFDIDQYYITIYAGKDNYDLFIDNEDGDRVRETCNISLYDYLTCDHCNKCNADVKKIMDPFMEEIHEEEVEVTLCSDCYTERMQDI